MPNRAGAGRYQNGAARRKVKARHITAADNHPICALCHKPIDLSIKTPDPMSCELDEIIPFSRGGSAISYDNTQLTHRICNQKKGNKLEYTGSNKKPSELTLSQKW
jgi:5-methylcytosine-specific restriction endonuclease McrA